MKHVVDSRQAMFPFKNSLEQDVLAQLLFVFALEYAIWRVQVNPDSLKLNGTHQLLVQADDINILGRSVHITKKNTEALVDANKEIRVVVNADKTKYMVMSQDQNTGQSHRIKNDNSSFENVEEFKYLATTLTNQNSVQEEIKRRLKSGNACCHSMHNRSSSSLLSRNFKIKIQRTIILLVVLYGCETSSLTEGGTQAVGV